MIEMPKLQPIQIDTKGKPLYMQIFIWIFSIREWKLIEDWFYTLRDGTKIVIPKEFLFNGASIPRPLWAILSPVGLLFIPGLIHDYAYQHNKLIQVDEQGNQSVYKPPEARRAFWDKKFLEIGMDVNGVAIVNVLAWIALRIGGWWAWSH